MPRIASNHHKLEETRKDSPLKTSERAWPYWHLGFGLLVSRNMRQYIFVTLSHPAALGNYNTKVVVLILEMRKWVQSVLKN